MSEVHVPYMYQKIAEVKNSCVTAFSGTNPVELQKEIAACFEGRKSLLNALYGLPMENSVERYCFRSELPDRFTQCFSRQEVEIYSGKDYIFECLELIMHSIREAVNNSDYHEYRHIYKSYSKCMGIPLFKYIGNTPYLVISNLPLNTLQAEMTVDCFNWIGERGVSWDSSGREYDRYFTDFITLDIPFSKLCSKEYLDELMWDNLDISGGVAWDTDEYGNVHYMMDIDDIDLHINGFTVDVSSIGRSALDRYYDSINSYKFKRVASYMSDQEVITSHSGYNTMIIKQPELVQLVRFLYVLRMCRVSDKFDSVYAEICNGGHSDKFKPDEFEAHALRWCSEYLKGEQINQEIYGYQRLFCAYKGVGYVYPNHYFYGNGERVALDLLGRLRGTRCFTSSLLDWMLGKAGFDSI